MQTIAQVREGHGQIAELIAQLRRIVEGEVPDSAAVTSVRWQMYRLLADHCAAEDQVVFHPLLTCGEARLMSLALRFREEMLPLTRRFRTGISDWSVERINREWSAYVAMMRDLLDELEQRIWFEDHLLLPLLQEHLQRRAA